MTKELYYIDEYIKEFDAEVSDCVREGDFYKIILDKTAFFPNEGGQYADAGTISNIDVVNVKKDGNEIIHYLKSKLEIGQSVHCILDFDKRFDKMQNHTGEHIVSGIIHNLFGYENVGFHLSDDELTMDTSGELTLDQIRQVELLANQVIYENLPITCIYPNPAELKTISYRSKLELTENVRLVKIGDVDICACCAPHVKSTGEVGMIKIVKSMRWKGGTRLNLECGKRALLDYDKRLCQLTSISKMTNTKINEVENAVNSLQNKVSELKRELKYSQLALGKAELFKEIHNKIPYAVITTGDMEVLREIVNFGMENTDKYILVLGGNDEAGYAFAAGISKGDIQNFIKPLMEKLSGRGGGKGNMVTGSLKCKYSEFLEYINL